MTADDYLRLVAFELRDLPWRARRELVSELKGHLAELPAGTELRTRLGSPEQYAADMRSAAGLERRRGVLAFLRARRPRNLLLTALVLTIVGLAIGAVVWIDSYQPLAFAGSTADPIGATQAPGGNSESVTFRKGRPFRYGIQIQNTGRFTVRVVGVPAIHGLPVLTRVFMSPPMTLPGIGTTFVPFRPFDLKAVQYRVLLLRGSYSRCAYWSPGLADTLWAFPVRYSFLWRTATVEIRLPEMLAIVFRKGSCPKQ